MNEQVARDVVLVRAIETADHAREILSEDDRRHASRSATELAQWQASHAGLPVTSDTFLQQRAGQILQRLSERHAAFGAISRWPGNLNLFWAGLPVVALLAGIFMERITDPHRVDLLSPPLLLIIGWNLVVYASLLVWRWLPFGKLKKSESTLVRLLSLGRTRLPRKLPPVLASALLAFMAEWGQLSRRLTLARLGRTLHLGSALFAIGAVLSLYARGYVAQYSAGWESTFLDAGQVHALLSALFMPAMAIFPLQGFSLADIEALRFGQVPSPPVDGARWVHLYAATLLLLVVLPRLLLAGAAQWRVKRESRNFPLDLEQPYFRKLLKALGGAPGMLRVLPYSFAVDEARDKGLNELASRLLGEQARLMLRPSIPYGDEPREALRNVRLNDSDATITAVLFSLAATPEKENHGALLDHLVRASARGIAVLVDESGYLERVGTQAGGKERMAERIALWQQFCRFHKAPATFVNLLHPDAHALDDGAGLALSVAA
ncbi:DUF2868 domain-containing protein [Polaromonas sp. CG_9.11]|uniref:DUF2868 domain-containing protein n=1 Tax=Polaromonas sp. CG_9.11 TaxID=2787730 RepID=UPI0018CB4433|nr:DUF2868 domain-containing protein [Polaromonas sp. CG_9.11]MBG6074915.1 hypothetical protein [Polaromonas sp. CG_9.11]